MLIHINPIFLQIGKPESQKVLEKATECFLLRIIIQPLFGHKESDSRTHLMGHFNFLQLSVVLFFYSSLYSIRLHQIRLSGFEWGGGVMVRE